MKVTEISDLDLLPFSRRLSKTDHRRFHVGECFDYRRSARREHQCLTRVRERGVRALLPTRITKLIKVVNCAN